MSRPDHEPLFNHRASDDPYHRVQVLAEKRAARNGRDVAQAGRDAVALRRSVVAKDHEPNVELIISTVAGEYAR